MPNDDKNPAQKMKDLHDWLLSNKVPASPFERPPMTWATNQEPRAARELTEFKEWIREIQLPSADFFEPHW